MNFSSTSFCHISFFILNSSGEYKNKSVNRNQHNIIILQLSGKFSRKANTGARYSLRRQAGKDKKNTHNWKVNYTITILSQNAIPSANNTWEGLANQHSLTLFVAPWQVIYAAFGWHIAFPLYSAEDFRMKWNKTNALMKIMMLPCNSLSALTVCSCVLYVFMGRVRSGAIRG